MQQTLTMEPVTFGTFVFGGHKKMLTWAFAGMVCLFLIYKLIYPFPDFYVDSYHYIAMAADRNFYSVWPIGYSWFLRAVHWISPSHYLLIVIQYLLLQASTFWLAFTLFYYFQPPQWVRSAIIAFLVVNPLSFYLANLVSSDLLFTALSLCWLTVLIRMVYDAQFWQVLLQGPLLAYLFLIRYQALYYPLVMILALWMAEFRIGWKIVSALLAFGLFGWIIKVTIRTNEQWYGIPQFSGQAGWITANNALYMYPYIQVDTAALQNNEVKALDQYVRRFFEAKGLMQHNYTPRDGAKYILGGEVMWYHLFGLMQQSPGKPVFWYYNRIGKYWGEYGRQLIKEHPMAYIRYYLIPNLGVYLFPILEQFERYNMGETTVPAGVVSWFQLSGNTISCRWPDGAGYLIGMFRPLFLLLNLYLLVMTIVIIRQKKLRSLHPLRKRILLLIATSFIGNAIFFILASPSMVRYQSYSILLGGMLLILLLPLAFFRSVPETSA